MLVWDMKEMSKKNKINQFKRIIFKSVCVWDEPFLVLTWNPESELDDRMLYFWKFINPNVWHLCNRKSGHEKSDEFFQSFCHLQIWNINTFV